MKITRILFLVSVVALLSVAPVFAQTTGWTSDPVTVNISANMPELTQLRFEATGNPIDMEDPDWVNIGTMSERTNRTAGYTVSVTSANGGQLSGPESVPYELRYGGTVYNDLSSAVTVSSSGTRTSFAGVPNDVDVLPVVDLEADFPLQGTYTDTLTFTITGQ